MGTFWYHLRQLRLANTKVTFEVLMYSVRDLFTGCTAHSNVESAPVS